MSASVDGSADLQKQNERLKRKLARSRARLEESRRQVEELQRAHAEVKEELEAVKAVVEVYDKHRPQAGDKKAGALDGSSSEEDFEDDEMESFDKTSARDDAHLVRVSKPKNGADKYGMDLMRSSASATSQVSRKSPSLLSDLPPSSGSPRAESSSKRHHERIGSADSSHRSTLTSSTGSSRDDQDASSGVGGKVGRLSDSPGGSRPSPTMTGPGSRPKRRDVPVSITATAGRKYHTSRDIGVSLSKEDEAELFGNAKLPALNTRATVNPGDSPSMAPRTPRMATIDGSSSSASGSAPRHTSSQPLPTDTRPTSSGHHSQSSLPTSSTPTTSTASSSTGSKRPKSNKSPEESANDEAAELDSTAAQRDQPKIFDENTVRDILCGLSITMSRTFNDDLLVPEDYSYSYQFKVRRVPQQLLKFKDFAPKVFQQIRQHWGVDNAELLLSFGYDNLDAIRGEGKSGAFFIFTRDKRFILKTATGPERDFLWEMLPYYFLYIRKNPNTLLPRFYGVYSMKHEGIGGMVRFVVMNNWFSTPSPLNEVYDLKGSTLGRSSGEDVKQGSILKDLDIKRKIYLDEDIKKLYLDQLYMDSQFLAQHNVMDYSLLVGIHYDTKEGRAARDKKAAEWSKLYTEDASYRSLFQTDDFGIAGWNPDEQRREVYFIGIIDILQKYTSKKRFEHLLKSIPYKAATVSVVEPSFYAKRFHNFLTGVTADSPQSVSKARDRLYDEVFEEEYEESEEDIISEEATTASTQQSNKRKSPPGSGHLQEDASSAPSNHKKSKKPKSTPETIPEESPEDGEAQQQAQQEQPPKKRKKKKAKSVEEERPQDHEISESSEEEAIIAASVHKSKKKKSSSRHAEQPTSDPETTTATVKESKKKSRAHE